MVKTVAETREANAKVDVVQTHPWGCLLGPMPSLSLYDGPTIYVILRTRTQASEGELNRTDMGPRDHKEMALGGRVAVLEGDIIFVLDERIKLLPRRVFGRSAHLKDDVEILLCRGGPAEDTLCHWLTNVCRGRPEVRYGEGEGDAQ